MVERTGSSTSQPEGISYKLQIYDRLALSNKYLVNVWVVRCFVCSVSNQRASVSVREYRSENCELLIV